MARSWVGVALPVFALPPSVSSLLNILVPSCVPCIANVFLERHMYAGDKFLGRTCHTQAPLRVGTDREVHDGRAKRLQLDTEDGAVARSDFS